MMNKNSTFWTLNFWLEAFHSFVHPRPSSRYVGQAICTVSLFFCSKRLRHIFTYWDTVLEDDSLFYLVVNRRSADFQWNYALRLFLTKPKKDKISFSKFYQIGFVFPKGYVYLRTNSNNTL